MTGERPPKDFWEKLDVVSKLVSGILLAVIAILVQQGASRIATSWPCKNIRVTRGKVTLSVPVMQ
jgi:hypothetical protein